ncbi:MAG: hypothetical protein HYZ92_03630 [Candidatus Omnitrophica bacterium]|nr:hypothetical protein [Candidatus Omnitrophota bacterium]
MFSEERRNISSDELKQARAKDDDDQKEFEKSYGCLYSESSRLGETSPINDMTKCLQDTQSLLELASAVGGDLEREINVLLALESKFVDLLNSKLAQGTNLMQTAHSLSAVNRIPFLAQSKRLDTPILKTEELPSLLSEDMETIKTMGFVSRSFPNFRPNGDDVKKCLDEAVKNGLDVGYAREVMEAWNSPESSE